MNKKTIILLIIFIGLIIYNLPFAKEYRAYRSVVNANTSSSCIDYMNEYPDGRHLEDVLYLKIGLDGNQMDDLVDYLQNFPQGKYYNEVNRKCDELWDAEIIKYNNRNSKTESSDAINFMSEMLRYMKKNRINSVIVQIHPTIKLKDYDEYDESTRAIIEYFNDSKLSIKDNMVSIKKNFTQADNNTLMEILNEGIQQSMNKMFTPGFIRVISDNSPSSACPIFNFDYTINTQSFTSEGIEYPEIWTYTEDKVAKNYLLGIKIVFNALFSIPGSTVSYSFVDRGEPENDISNVENIRDGYRIMTSMCFAQFSNKISSNLGLQEYYFQGDE